MTEKVVYSFNRHRCSRCNKPIEKGTIFYSIKYSNSFGGDNKNICIKCMLEAVAKSYTLEEFKKARKELILDELK